MAKRPAAKKTEVPTPIEPETVTTIPDSFESPESGTIERASYDGEQRTMTVFFKRGMRPAERYDYDGIPLTLWEQFTRAESKGRFFSMQIRPRYAGKPYEPRERT